MITSTSPSEIRSRLAEIHQLCPEMRFGQLVATIGLLAEDETGRNIWDVEDDEFIAAMERLATDLSQRK